MLTSNSFQCAFAGACTGLTTMAYVVIRAKIAIASKEIVHPTKPVSTAGCTYHFDNVTTVYQDPMIHEEFDKSIHHVSFLFYTLIGVCSTAIPGLLYACCFGKQEVSQLNPLVVAPFLRSHFFPKKTADQNNLVHLYEKAETKL